MNYARIYYQIIDRRMTNPVAGYAEKHHIVPVSLGGSDSKDNLVLLSAREHFICHWLLVKMYKGYKPSYYKMLKAFNMMLFAHSGVQDRYYKTTSRLFDIYRKDLALSQSFTQQGENNSQFGTRWICNRKQQVNKKILKSDPLPDGWEFGRNKWVTKEKPVKETQTRLYKNGFKVIVDGKIYDSISQAADFLKIGHETARMRFKSNSFPSYIIIKE